MSVLCDKAHYVACLLVCLENFLKIDCQITCNDILFMIYCTLLFNIIIGVISLENNKEKSGNATAYTVSAIAVVLICGIILGISLLWPEPKSDAPADAKIEEAADSSSLVMTGEEYLASSDAIAGETSSDIDREMTAEILSGKYVDERDGWCYKFEYTPSQNYDGVFYAAFESVIDTASGEILTGNWKLENGEIKLFSGDVYLESLWACTDYVVDSKALFVGEINPELETQQAMLVCKDSTSGEVRILNLYDDGKVVFEISNITQMEASAESAATSSATGSILLAGTYVKENDTIKVKIAEDEVPYKIIDGGLASWVYVKRVD